LKQITAVDSVGTSHFAGDVIGGAISMQLLRRWSLRLALFLVAGTFAGTAAEAKTTLPAIEPPKGFCVPGRPLTPAESAMVARLDGGTSRILKIAAVYVDCPSVPALAKGHFGDVKRWAVIATGRSVEPIASRKDFIDSFVGSYVIDSGELMKRLDKAVDGYTARYASDPGYGRDRAMMLGVVDRDDRAVYKASVINLSLANSNKVYASVNGMTTMGQMIVRISMHAPHRRNAIYGELLAAVRRAIADLDAR
jgi:hypothetical protein